jgi:hypothetical protein
MVMYLRVPYNAVNFLTSWVTISFSRRAIFHGVHSNTSINPTEISMGYGGG